MLNEIREYEQYTGDPEKVRRLDASALTKDFSGIERPLIMLARGLILTDPDGELQNEACVVRGPRLWCGLRRKKECRVIEETPYGLRWKSVPQEIFRKKASGEKMEIRVLKNPKIFCLPEEILLEVRGDFHLGDTEKELWTAYMSQWDMIRCRDCQRCRIRGLSSADTETYRKMETLDHWLLRYAQYWYPKGYEEDTEDGERHHRLEKAMAGRRQEYDQPLFSRQLSEEEYGRTNTFRKIGYQGVIAKALEMGELRKRYLAAENVKGTELPGVKVFKEDGALRGKYSASEMDVICKMTAAYLLAGGGKAGEWVFVNATDISNWGKSEFRNEKGKAGRLSYYFFLLDGQPPSEKQPLFEKVMVGQNAAKLRVCPEWMEACGWRLVSEDELDILLEKNPEMLYFRDDGGRADLSIRKRYE